MTPLQFQHLIIYQTAVIREINHLNVIIEYTILVQIFQYYFWKQSLEIL